MALPDLVLYVIVILTSDNTRVYYLGHPIPSQRRSARSFIFVTTRPHREGIKHDRERNPVSGSYDARYQLKIRDLWQISSALITNGCSIRQVTCASGGLFHLLPQQTICRNMKAPSSRVLWSLQGLLMTDWPDSCTNMGRTLRDAKNRPSATLSTLLLLTPCQ